MSAARDSRAEPEVTVWSLDCHFIRDGLMNERCERIQITVLGKQSAKVLWVPLDG